MKFRFQLVVLTLALAIPTLSRSQSINAPQDFCKGGQIVVVRVNSLTPTGTREGFEKAAADQAAWYRSHGFTGNRLITQPVIEQDPKSKVWSVSAREFISLHINPPPIAAVKADDAYRAFVQEFRANSELLSDKSICVEGGLK